MDNIKALRLCYRILLGMDRNTQIASLQWLLRRLASDERSADSQRADPLMAKRAFRNAVGDAAISLLAMLKATGAASARRSVEVRGPINADVILHVRPRPSETAN